jgi:hypothetical protein
MQNALQNPHYKKIWEEVNWDSRNPQAKSLEEALKFERKEPLNLLVAYSWPRDRIFTSVEYDTRNFDNGMARVECVLGRPITLEDILLLLKGYFAGINLDISGIFKFNAIGQPADWSIIEWDFTKPLHEQTPETWEKIANLI